MPPKNLKRKATATDGTTTPHVPSLAEQLSYLYLPRPFKNPEYAKNLNRRAKNLKNVMGQERERERADREKRRLEKMEKDAQDAMDVDEKEVVEDEAPSYLSIEAPPSVLPQKHYCDITGLEAPYTDPVTGLRYHDKDVYALIKEMSASTAKEYLSARGVNSIVK
ncbi:YL1 nuclear protein C-terminal domain-containing protein [Lentinula detonsa]|uniref:YL1 nuclear protein C-terminal domain-containing protein n=2 Tax=Lentinula TaxID=5352 RepID=A0A9W8TWI2_9AGAR|nr:YL1 nuclear protein C-terminal domain-containing protein [Lentinula detonsa]KAJ3789067.1 YL1 nuclear protein C-terminal domain-containing protein [Lentinula aff. detonsa]KAJ3986973.1 YL1 nuclear protein C-terminal domain-containing protein [Lentinula detonsa]